MRSSSGVSTATAAHDVVEDDEEEEDVENVRNNARGAA
jgi:hypothetical protein